MLLGGTAHGATDRKPRGLPPVPGMLGDRRANELWYQLDEISLYHPSQEVQDAYAVLFPFIQETLRKASTKPGAP